MGVARPSPLQPSKIKPAGLMLSSPAAQTRHQRKLASLQKPDLRPLLTGRFEAQVALSLGAKHAGFVLSDAEQAYLARTTAATPTSAPSTARTRAPQPRLNVPTR